ncbi:MAG: DMT family transporter [Alphaproteobacteria bacterium]|nr:DMT family transporter [Alphaproteobacteria bacterium]
MSSLFPLSKTKAGLALAVFSAIIYGFCPAPARAVYADGANAIFVVLIAITVRAVLMGTYCLYKKLPLFAAQTNWKRTIASGFLQALSVFGTMSSLLYLESALTWIILFSHPMIILLIQSWRDKQRLSPLTFGLTGAAFLGLTFVLDVWSTHSDLNSLGVALACLGGLSTAARTYIYGKQLSSLSPFVVGAENYVIGLFFLLFLLLWKQPVPPQSLIGFLWLSVSLASMIIGSFCTFVGIAKMGAFRWSLLSKMELVFVTLFSTVFFGEVLKTSQYLGIVFVLACLVAYQFSEKPQTLGDVKGGP